MILKWGASEKKKPFIRLRRLSGLFIFIPRLSELSSGSLLSASLFSYDIH